jgi:hypothetical protein
MNLEFLQYTDSKLVELLEDKPSRKEAKREITRRKAVGSWRLMAGWNPEAEESSTEERVYAPGVKRT